MPIHYTGNDAQIREILALLNRRDPSGATVLLTAEACGGATLTVKKKGDRAVIRFGRRVELFRGIGLLFEHRGQETYETTQPCVFSVNGVMLDCSRNAVLQEKTVRKIIRYLALMGLNTLMLYTENTYTVPEYPYFGYMRGRYTERELKSLNEYAASYGVEMIPCIQTLAHLDGALRWRAFSGLSDTEDTLLADDERTYDLIEAMVRACRAAYTTDRIHIGMDEAVFMGLGQYRLLHGEQCREEVFCRHLERVTAICKAYGFRPMIWSDMIFRLVSGQYYEGEIGDGSPLRTALPEVDLVYWDYYRTAQEDYERTMAGHRVLKNKLLFAGCAWRWASFAPSVQYSMRVSRMALNACLKQGVGEAFATAWGDDGSESSVFTVLPTLQLYAEYGYGMPTDDAAIAARLEACTGESLADMQRMDLPDLPSGDVIGPSADPCKYLLYQDPLCSLFDRHIAGDYPQRYAEFAGLLREAAARSATLGYAFAMLARLCDLLSHKCRYHTEVMTAYRAGDRDAVREIARRQLPLLQEKLSAFAGSAEAQWTEENKSWGYEVTDIRLGGLSARLETAKKRLLQWADGETDRIEELDEPRLTFGNETDMEPVPTYCYLWRQMVSAGRI